MGTASPGYAPNRSYKVMSESACNEIAPKRQILRLSSKVETSTRQAKVAPVRRTTRYFVYVYGKGPPKKIHKSLGAARTEAARLVEVEGADHAFVLHIVESAKLVMRPRVKVLARKD